MTEVSPDECRPVEVTVDGKRPDDWCTCGHARDEHRETGQCLGNHRIENPDFFPGEAFTEDAECYCWHFEFWYADEAALPLDQRMADQP